MNWTPIPGWGLRKRRVCLETLSVGIATRASGIEEDGAVGQGVRGEINEAQSLALSREKRRGGEEDAEKWASFSLSKSSLPRLQCVHPCGRERERKEDVLSKLGGEETQFGIAPFDLH